MESNGDAKTQASEDSLIDFDQYFQFLGENWRNIISLHKAHSFSGKQAQSLVLEEFVKLNRGNEQAEVKAYINQNQGAKHGKKIVGSYDLKNPYLEETRAGGEIESNNPELNDSTSDISKPELENGPLKQKPKFTVPLKQKVSIASKKILTNPAEICLNQQEKMEDKGLSIQQKKVEDVYR